jgi:hypothetical protein
MVHGLLMALRIEFCGTFIILCVSFLLSKEKIVHQFISIEGGRWQVCKVIHVSAPEDCTQHRYDVGDVAT